MRQNVQGSIYLLHFDRPFKHAKHYVGWTEDDTLEPRLEDHRRCRGSRLMAAVVQAGIDFSLARLWRGDRHLERRIKRMKATPQLCPICNPKTALHRMAA